METLHLSGGEWPGRARALASEGWLLSDLCGLDRLGLSGGARFHVVVQLVHHERKERLTVHVEAQGEPPSVPSVTEVWPTAAFMEREAYDLFGIVFDGHPRLARILMPDDWEGHPLRKDYGVGKVPVEFVPQPLLQVQAPGQSPRPAEAGVEADRLGQGGEPARREGGRT
jgi:NADH:ubiquinone oxidoreductase subunit C